MLSNKFTFFLFVIIPTIIAGIYYSNYASDKYISESRYIIQGNEQGTADVLGMVTGLTGMAASTPDSLAVLNYTVSHDFLNKVLPNIDIMQHYGSPEYDWWARIPADATQEDLLDYWDNEIINITYDNASGISKLEVTAFDAKVAKQISSLVLRINERFINNLSSEARTDALAFAQDEVIKAETELLSIRSRLARFNEKEKVISAEQAAQAEQSIVASLKQQIATKEAELKSLSNYMQSNSLKVRSLVNEINSLKRQTLAQQSKWADPATGKTVTQVVLDTEQLTSELAFAEKLYLTALSSLKQAQIDASQKQRYLDIIVPPHLTDESLEPERIYSTFSVFLASLMLWGIFALLISAIKDNLGWA
jgi:BexC/CtrB/KpsE family polysaccharide export inner-membrane protein